MGVNFTENYFVYHLHSDYSTCVANADSATKIDAYINRAKELGMTALCFSEHGNIYNWWEKRTKVLNAGMKWIHGIEAYITFNNIDDKDAEKSRDNYHTVLIAKNHEGFLELNKLVSNSVNRKDGHFYYVPRISFKELKNTSSNIIVTSACIASPLGKGTPEEAEEYINFFVRNKDRCFLEIQHHNVDKQKDYNEYLIELSKRTGVRLVAGTDTHSIDEEHAKAREILLKAKHNKFDDEEGWDLTFKSYDELLNAYSVQNSVPHDVYMEAIRNTKVIEDACESYDFDLTPKYPNLFKNPEKEFRTAIYDCLEKHPYALKNHTREELDKRIEEEIEVYKKTNSISYMLFQKYLRDREHKHGIYTGPSRGSVSGSMIAYILGITDIDSIKFDLNFFRFLNPDRQTTPDIDSDYYADDREKAKELVLTDKTLNTCEIAAFSTIAIRGAVREVGRALEIPLDKVNDICDRLVIDSETGEETLPKDVAEEYPELAYYSELLNGVIVSVGNHPAGILCSTDDIYSEIGLSSILSIDKKVKYITQLDKHGIEEMNWIKMDFLGLDNVGVINNTCKLAGIERVTPDNIPLDDMAVWDEMSKDTTCIFQFESGFASQLLKNMFSKATIKKIRDKFPDISYLRLMSFCNGLIRPGAASFRDEASRGIFKDNGLKEINDLLGNELGHLCMQESIMKFLVQFCGYSAAESDNCRRAIAKKKGTEQLIPEIESRFVDYTSKNYGVPADKCKEIIKPFIQTILDASSYAFSWNHSVPYSFIGYACVYLRHYYPLEFITSCLNVWKDKPAKTKDVIAYANSKKIYISEPRFRYGRTDYFIDKESKTIYKGMRSIKYCNSTIADELFALRNNQYDYFMDLLIDIDRKTSVDSRQLDLLIKLDFFSEFGNSRMLDYCVGFFRKFKEGNAKQMSKALLANDSTLEEIVRRNSRATEKTYLDLNTAQILHECEEQIQIRNPVDYPIGKKIEWQQEFLGYTNIQTGKEEDKLTLVVLGIRYLMTKDKSKCWAAELDLMSIGTGIKNKMMIFKRVLDKTPLKVYNIIKVEYKNMRLEKRGEYSNWYLDKYNLVE